MGGGLGGKAPPVREGGAACGSGREQPGLAASNRPLETARTLTGGRASLARKGKEGPATVRSTAAATIPLLTERSNGAPAARHRGKTPARPISHGRRESAEPRQRGAGAQPLLEHRQRISESPGLSIGRAMARGAGAQPLLEHRQSLTENRQRGAGAQPLLEHRQCLTRIMALRRPVRPIGQSRTAPQRVKGKFPCGGRGGKAPVPLNPQSNGKGVRGHSPCLSICSAGRKVTAILTKAP